MKQLKILCLARTTLRDFGRHRYRKIIESFIDRGVETTLLSYCYDSGVPITGLHKEIVVKNSINNTPEPNFQNANEMIIAAISLCRKEKYDAVIILYPDPLPSFAGIIVGRTFHLPIFMDFGDLFSGLVNVQHKVRDFQKLEYSQKENWVIQHSDYIAVINNFLKSKVLQLGKKENKVVVIPNGANKYSYKNIDTTEYCKRFNINPKLKTILYSGTIDYDKGIDKFLSIIHFFAKKRRKDLQFVIAGKGQEAKLLNFLKRLPKYYQPNVHFVGPLRKNLISEAYVHADVLLVPFEATPFSRASCPLKIFEAMASKCCVIASRLEGIGEIITHEKNGILCNPNNEKEFVFAINKVLKDKKLYRKLVDNAYRLFLKRYDWGVLMGKYNTFIQNKINEWHKTRSKKF